MEQVTQAWTATLVELKFPPPLENSGYRSVCITTARDVLHFSFQNTTEAAVLSIMLQTELYGGNKFYYIA